MRNIFKTFTHKTKKQLSVNELDHRNLSVLNADELYQLLNLYNMIRNIRKKVGIDAERFELMYGKPIARFCELVQLIPASQAHHHAFPGGLIIHTLSVIENAVHLRQKYVLPLASEPDIIEAQKNLWTYAVFAAALLHDAAKVITMTQLIDASTDSTVSVASSTLLEQQVKRYEIKFKPTKFYKLHEKISLLFLAKLFDNHSIDYLTSNLDIFTEVVAYISSDKQNWGSIGEIIQTADKQSAAKDLKIAKDTRKFTGAEIENFGERLIRALRVLINQNKIKVNVPGAVIYTTNTYAYAIAKPIADKIREFMKSEGATDVPTDNNRIFDELAQNNLIETNEEDKAIHRIDVSIDSKEFKQTFTCLKFKINRIFNVSNVPSSTEVTINESVLSSHEDVAIKDPTNIKNTTEVETSSEANNSDDDIDKNSSQQHGEEPEINQNNNEKEKKNPEVIVNEFFEWIHEKIETKEFVVNKPGNPIFIVEHKSKKMLAIVTPRTFATFATESGLFQCDTLDANKIKQAASLVQSAIHKTKIHTPSYNKQIHYRIPIKSKSAKPKLAFYFFELEKIKNKMLRQLLEQFEISENLKEFTKI